MPYGVTESMIATYAEAIFDLGLNIQVRRGDAVRELDMAAIAAQRDGTGLTDAEIAARLGLHEKQVTFIRVLHERRVFRRDQHDKLFPLGAGKRYRATEYVDPQARLALGDGARRLRESLAFAPERVRGFLADGSWTAETLGGLLALRAQADAERPAVASADDVVTWGTLDARVDARLSALAAAGLARGEVAALDAEGGITAVVDLLAVARLGAVALPLPRALDGRRRAACLAHAMARLDLAAGLEPSSGGPSATVVGAVAGDPVLLLPTGGETMPRLAIHTHQTLLAAARGLQGTHGGPPPVARVAAIDLGRVPVLLALCGALLDGALLRREAAAGATLAIATSDGARRQFIHGAGATDFAVMPEAEPLWGCEEAPCYAFGRHPEPMPGHELRVAGGHRVRGPALFGGYLGDAPATVSVQDAEGWLRTGA